MKTQTDAFSMVYLPLYERKNLNVLLFSFGKDFFENICKFSLQCKTVVLFFFFNLVNFSLTLISEICK